MGVEEEEGDVAEGRPELADVGRDGLRADEDLRRFPPAARGAAGFLRREVREGFARGPEAERFRAPGPRGLARAAVVDAGRAAGDDVGPHADRRVRRAAREGPAGPAPGRVGEARVAGGDGRLHAFQRRFRGVREQVQRRGLDGRRRVLDRGRGRRERRRRVSLVKVVRDDAQRPVRRRRAGRRGPRFFRVLGRRRAEVDVDGTGAEVVVRERAEARREARVRRRGHAVREGVGRAGREDRGREDFEKFVRRVAAQVLRGGPPRDEPHRIPEGAVLRRERADEAVVHVGQARVRRFSGRRRREDPEAEAAGEDAEVRPPGRHDADGGAAVLERLRAARQQAQRRRPRLVGAELRPGVAGLEARDGVHRVRDARGGRVRRVRAEERRVRPGGEGRRVAQQRRRGGERVDAERARRAAEPRAERLENAVRVGGDRRGRRQRAAAAEGVVGRRRERRAVAAARARVRAAAPGLVAAERGARAPLGQRLAPIFRLAGLFRPDHGLDDGAVLEAPQLAAAVAPEGAERARCLVAGRGPPERRARRVGRRVQRDADDGVVARRDAAAAREAPAPQRLGDGRLRAAADDVRRRLADGVRLRGAGHGERAVVGRPAQIVEGLQGHAHEGVVAAHGVGRPRQRRVERAGRRVPPERREARGRVRGDLGRRRAAHAAREVRRAVDEAHGRGRRRPAVVGRLAGQSDDARRPRGGREEAQHAAEELEGPLLGPRRRRRVAVDAQAVERDHGREEAVDAAVRSAELAARREPPLREDAAVPQRRVRHAGAVEQGQVPLARRVAQQGAVVARGRVAGAAVGAATVVEGGAEASFERRRRPAAQEDAHGDLLRRVAADDEAGPARVAAAGCGDGEARGRERFADGGEVRGARDKVAAVERVLAVGGEGARGQERDEVHGRARTRRRPREPGPDDFDVRGRARGRRGGRRRPRRAERGRRRRSGGRAVAHGEQRRAHVPGAGLGGPRRGALVVDARRRQQLGDAPPLRLARVDVLRAAEARTLGGRHRVAWLDAKAEVGLHRLIRVFCTTT